MPDEVLPHSDQIRYSSVQVQFGRGELRKFYFRAKTSDATVIDWIFKKNQYDLRRLRRWTELREFCEHQKTAGKLPLIVDAGAYIGASSLYFAANFPNARVVAIEPDAENFRLLEMNVQGLCVRPIRAAISSTPGLARMVNPGEGHWGYRTENIVDNFPCEDPVPRLTINEIYRQHSSQWFPYIVKLDIEGGEADVFLSGTEWVSRTPILIIELHDWLLTKRANSQAFLKCISQLDRDFVFIGEDVYSIANNLQAELF